MYSLFKNKATRFTGMTTYPQLDYLRRSYLKQIEDVKAYYNRYPKRVDADNLIGNILVHIPNKDDLDDTRYLRYVEDTADGVARAMGLTSSTYRGRVHERGITLGSKSNEVMLSVTSDRTPLEIVENWTRVPALNYIYHSRTDLGLPILNNQSSGKAFGVSTLNIPLLALQYRHWLRYQNERYDQKESVYRFVGGFVLPNALDSYLDIAFFNRLSRASMDIGTPKYPVPHPFFLTNHLNRVDGLIKWILNTQEQRSEDIQQLANMTPVLIKSSLWDVMQLPKDPVTRHNEWALQIAYMPYIKYIVHAVIRKHRGDRTLLNNVYLSLVEANRDNIFSGVGSPDIVKQYRAQMTDMIEVLKEFM